MPLGLKVVHEKGNADALMKRLREKSPSVYVGIPAASAAERASAAADLADLATGPRKKHIQEASEQDVNNAELLFIFSKGSPARNQDPRPVLEPAIEADGNRQPISRELAGMAKAHLDGDKAKEMEFANRAALAGQNAARDWFTDSRNSWSPNAPSTIAAKGSDRPGIDLGLMRGAIVGIVDPGEK